MADNTQKLKINYSGISDIGLVRSENQDSFGKFPTDNYDIYSDKGQLFILADGMGGHRGGKEASRMAVEIISEVFFGNPSSDTGSSIKNAIETANMKIYQKAGSSSEFHKMGTTCLVLVLKNNKAVIGHVGDSRIYKIENGKIEQVTTDHTQVQEMLREGVLTKEEAKVYPLKSVLSRALGVEEKVKPDIIEDITLSPGQIFVLCSDGLAKVTPDEISDVALNHSPQEAVSVLVNLANERGGHDNVTVQVIKIESEGQSTAAQPDKIFSERNTEKKKKIKIAPLLGIILIASVLTIAGLQFGGEITSLFKSKTVSEQQQTVDEQSPEGNDLLQKADLLFNQGNYEKAFLSYKEILDDDPMHLGALQGIDKIVSYYFNKGEELRKKENFTDALDFYRKAERIRPADERIKNFILICENRIKSENQDEIENESINENPPSEENLPLQITKFTPADWKFIDVDPNHYNLSGSSIELSNSAKDKKVIFEKNLMNAVVTIDFKLFYIKDNSGLGIIFGYNTSPNENYYLFKYGEKDNYSLQKISGGSAEQLLFVHRERDADETDLRLKVVCSGNRVSIYSRKGLLSSWVSPQAIEGKVGFFADKDVAGSFTNLNLTGTKKD
jgi:serine/threonine protein phosphatase PrpC